jgi:hypothetical protein
MFRKTTDYDIVPGVGQFAERKTSLEPRFKDIVSLNLDFAGRTNHPYYDA